MPSVFLCTRFCVRALKQCQLAADLRRLLQALQNFGQVVPFSILFEAFASFHSAPHFSAARASQADRRSAPSSSLHSSLRPPAARRRSKQIATLAL
jgi:hypothetical protein